MKLTQHFLKPFVREWRIFSVRCPANRKAYIIYGNTIATDVKNQVVLEPRDCIILRALIAA